MTTATATSDNHPSAITLRPVDRTNWRAVIALQVTPPQREFVTEVSHYLLLCHYDDVWHPLAVYQDEQVIGFLMWGIDPADGSCWLGGILIDEAHQGRGCGRAAVQAALNMLAGEYRHDQFALSYNPDNTVARSLYTSLGFVETGEWVDGEVVARLHLADG